MLVEYGANAFQLENITKWDMRAVYSEDGVDFLYYHLRLSLVMVWNPAATTSPTDSPPGGNLGAVSVARIKQAMLIPRQILRLSLGNIAILESPPVPRWNSQRLSLDCKNGPNPIDFRVLRIDGIKTLICSWEVETYLNDMAAAEDDFPYYLLSHRWEETHRLDELFYTTRIIRGRAVFRNDFLVQRGQARLPPATPQAPSIVIPYAGLPWWTTWAKFPDGAKPVQAQAGIAVDRLYADDFRARLLHQPSQDFKLMDQDTKLSSDGSTLDYTIVHKQQPINLLPERGVVKFAGKWSYGFPQNDFFDLAGVSNNLTLQLWGSRQTPRNALLVAAKKALAFYAMDSDLTHAHAYYHSNIVFDLFDRHLELTVGYMASGAGKPISVAAGNYSKADDFTGDFPESDEAITTTTNVRPRPSFDSGTRSCLVRARSQTPGTPHLVPRRPINDPNWSFVIDFTDK